MFLASEKVVSFCGRFSISTTLSRITCRYYREDNDVSNNCIFTSKKGFFTVRHRTASKFEFSLGWRNPIFATAEFCFRTGLWIRATCSEWSRGWIESIGTTCKKNDERNWREDNLNNYLRNCLLTTKCRGGTVLGLFRDRFRTRGTFWKFHLGCEGLFQGGSWGWR